MNFAICDGNVQSAEELISVIENYSADRKIAINYALFHDFEDLEERIDEFDLFFLDHSMPDFDGLNYARIIREKGGNKKIIVFTSYDTKAVFEAFTVNAHRYIIKPLEEEKVFEALDSVFLQNGADGCLMFKSGGRICAVNISDILYIEVMRKDSYIHCKQGVMICRRTITSLEEELQGKRFFRIHRSYLVNMNNVRYFDNKYVEFPNGIRIDISLRKYNEFCQAMEVK